MRSDRTARAAFSAGVALAVIALGTDTLDTDPWSESTRLKVQTVEEGVELLAQSLMVLGLGLFALGRPGASTRMPRTTPGRDLAGASLRGR
jgi:hypothetical protein